MNWLICYLKWKLNHYPSRDCETRWECRFKNSDAVLNNFGAIISILVKEVEGLNRDVPQAIGNNQLYEHFNLW